MAKLQEESDSGKAHDKSYDCGKFGVGGAGSEICCGNVPGVGRVVKMEVPA